MKVPSFKDDSDKKNRKCEKEHLFTTSKRKSNVLMNGSKKKNSTYA